MNLRQKLASILRQHNDEEVGDYNSRAWGAVVETDMVTLANEVGVEFTLAELDDVYGASACIAVKRGRNIKVQLFASMDEAGPHWDSIASQVFA
jgi:hypothetical protein